MGTKALNVIEEVRSLGTKKLDDDDALGLFKKPLSVILTRDYVNLLITKLNLMI